MKSNYMYFLLAGFLTLASCEDDKEPVMELQNAASFNALSQNSIVLTNDNKDAAFPVISWTKADYGVSAVVNYEVTLTNTTTNKSVVMAETGSDQLAFTNGEMNALMAKTGACPGQTYDFTVSLVSKSYDAFADASGNTLSFKATTFDPNVADITWKYAYVAVGYPNWDYTTAYVIGDPDGDGVFDGYANFDDAASYAVLDGADVTKVLAQGQSVDSKGFYQITVNANGDVRQTEPLSWEIIGDATSGGWSEATKMEYDADTRKWTLITPLLAKEMKFRANGNWDYNYGVEADGNILVAGGSNIKIEKDHAYIITLDLTNAGLYTYSLEETDIEQSSAFLSMPGSYQGWSPEADNAYHVISEARDFKYTGTFYLPANTEFKFYDGGTWMGMKGDPTVDEENNSVSFSIGDGDNIIVTDTGYYRFAVNTKKMTATITKTGWEVIGSAAPHGWDKGVLMTYVPEDKTWTITVTLTDGEIKFRWDGAWDINYGGSLGSLEQGGANIAVSAGTYTIVLNPDAKTATMKKN